MLRLDDIIQMGRTDDHIYSYDFSEGFNIVDLRYILKSSDEVMGFFLQSPLQNFKMYTQKENFDLAIIIAEELQIDSDELKNGMISTIRHATDITDDDLHSLSEELTKMYPMAIAAYYKESIRAIRQKAQAL